VRVIGRKIRYILQLLKYSTYSTELQLLQNTKDSYIGTKCNSLTQQTVTFSPYIVLLTLRDGKHKIQKTALV